MTYKDAALNESTLGGAWGWGVGATWVVS